MVKCKECKKEVWLIEERDPWDHSMVTFWCPECNHPFWNFEKEEMEEEEEANEN